jgi:hypothetical protein
MPEETENDALSTVKEVWSTTGQQIDDVSKAVVEIVKHVESAKSAAKEAADSKTSIASALADSQTKLADIETARTQALAAKTKIEADQTVIATKSAHIQDAQEHADKVRANLDRELTAATKQATDAEGQKTRAQSAADSTAELLTNVRTTKATADTDAEAIAAVRKTAEESTAITKGLADKSATIETRIMTYETQLDDLKVQCANQLKTLESLLPGAASAGLAHDFDKRRQTFLAPQRKWENWFIGSVVALVILATVSFLERYFSNSAPTWDSALLYWIFRIPVAGALIYLAIHSSHEAALAKRLEEDYGYKAAVASSFMGFHKQMTEVGSAAASNAPLAKLCNDTLSTMASPPGRIYDKHKLTVSPSRELKEAAETFVELAKTSMKGTG